MEGIGLRKVEVKMDFRIDVRDVNERIEGGKRNRICLEEIVQLNF